MTRVAIIFGQRTRRLVATAVGLVANAASIASAQSVALSAGYAEQTNIFGIAVVWDAGSPLLERSDWRLTGHIELDVMDLQGRRSNTTGYQSLAAIGVTPIARFEWPKEEHAPFIDVGIGINFFSHTTLQEEQNFGIALQFGELVGAGLRFGQKGAYEIGVRVEHMSNADIKFPNSGITMGLVRVAYHF
jgi:lipid A 3-O-deacylase